MSNKTKKPKIGFIGQGWIGKNYADDYEERGFQPIRYSRDPQHAKNGREIASCDMVFIAVPTPTTPEGFDDSILREVLKLVGSGKIAIIKSTILPRTTEKMQALYPDKIILHSPEFLTEKTAIYDARYPKRNIIGYVDERGEQAAKEVMKIFPDAPYKAIVSATTAELIKYANNSWFYFKIIYINILYDLADKLGVDYEQVREAMSFDPRIGHTHLDPVHQGGRGAAGHCFIKDFAAFTEIYKEYMVDDKAGNRVLESLEKKNIELLKSTNKDLDMLEDVYGKL